MKYKTRIYFQSGSFCETEIDSNVKIAPNFTFAEYVNKSAKDAVKAEFYPETWTHIKMMQEMRNTFGSMTISSWFRTKTFNASLKNADPRSAHQYGCAADWQKKGEKETDRKYKADVWKNLCNKYGVVGAINYYTNGYHLEILSDKCYGNSRFVIRDYRGKKGDW